MPFVKDFSSKIFVKKRHPSLECFRYGKREQKQEDRLENIKENKQEHIPKYGADRIFSKAELFVTANAITNC